MSSKKKQGNLYSNPCSSNTLPRMPSKLNFGSEEDTTSLLGKVEPLAREIFVKKRNYEQLRKQRTETFNSIAMVLLLIMGVVLAVNFAIVFGLGDNLTLFTGNPKKRKVSNQRIIFFNNIVLRANYDNANLASARELSAFELKFWSGGDSYYQQLPQKMRHSGAEWFQFQIKRLHQPVRLTFHFCNLRNSNLIEENGLYPVYRRKRSNIWRNLKLNTHFTPSIFNSSKDKLTKMTFRYDYNPIFDHDVQLALLRPWSYKKQIQFYSRLSKSILIDTNKYKGIYFKRELLVETKEARALNVYWVTKNDTNKLKGKQMPSKASGANHKSHKENSNKISNLDEVYSIAKVKTGSAKSSLVNSGKHVIVLMARSYGFDSISSEFLSKILTKVISKKSSILDDHVFVLIPMMNPDGVFHGYSRIDADLHNQQSFSLSARPGNSNEILAIKDFITDINSSKSLKAVFLLTGELGRKQVTCSLPSLNKDNFSSLLKFPYLLRRVLKKKHNFDPFLKNKQNFMKQLSILNDKLLISEVRLPSNSAHSKTAISGKELTVLADSLITALSQSLNPQKLLSKKQIKMMEKDTLDIFQSNILT